MPRRESSPRETSASTSTVSWPSWPCSATRARSGGIGLSNVSVEQLNAALPVGVACVQNAYSLLDRTGEPVLAACRDHDLAWVPFFPLGSAFSAWEKVTGDPRVVATAERLGATPAQVGLAWLLAHYEGTLLIPGTASVTHLHENIAAARLQLDNEAMTLLDPLPPPGAGATI